MIPPGGAPPRIVQTAALLFGVLFGLVAPAAAQQRAERGVVTGQVALAGSGVPVAGALVTLEGTPFQTLTDSAGVFLFRNVPPGPYVLLARLIGLAPSRTPITVAPGETVRRSLILAASALQLPDIVVTAAPGARAQGELGTASVIDRDAIANQTATSLMGVLELIPGVPTQAPGLTGVQQVSLRSVPTSAPASLTGGGPSAGDLSSFGTLIVLDGVPLSNNANLQSTGPRGELALPLASSAGGGVDLRRIPAATIERVEVIRGIPSARYGDLTQGVIIVDTRAATARPEAAATVDARSFEANLVGGHELGRAHALTGTMDVARTRLQPGFTADDATRVTVQLAHRLPLGSLTDAGLARAVLDSRLDGYRLASDNPEQPELFPGRASSSRESGLRLSERFRMPIGAQSTFTATASADYARQRSLAQASRLRSALPFTDRVDEGRAVGRYVEGSYISEVGVEGDAWQLYSRLEAELLPRALTFDHRVFAGVELRREWNDGAGFLFDIERPSQVLFNGVQGFDRPRRFDAIPPVATTAIYLDDRLVRNLGSMTLTAQVGLRLDLLHRGTTWLSGVRDAALQPRVNAEIAPWPWLRLRGGLGRTAKTPALGSLYPAPQYFDVVNVNWFTSDPAERLAVLTTFIRDPTNTDLGFAVGEKQEAGVRIATGQRELTLDVVVFRDGTVGGIGFRRVPGFLVRDLFDFADSTPGTGRPPTVIEPPTRADTVPILLDVPGNVLALANRGIEATLQLPELRPLRLRLHVQGALVRTSLADGGIDFGRGFDSFQVSGDRTRSPYWDGVTKKSERLLLTYRVVHHRPDLGLVITAVVEHAVREIQEDSAGTDTLSFAGYITRAGELVPLPRARRGDPEFADLRLPRTGSTVPRQDVPADWFLSLQVSKTLPFNGRLSFYAFNALDRPGRITGINEGRVFARMRFGLELTMPLGR
ncbi:MAG TPA: TonB-dependent receptor [Gemmatimonadales bacterium]